MGDDLWRIRSESRVASVAGALYNRLLKSDGTAQQLTFVPCIRVQLTGKDEIYHPVRLELRVVDHHGLDTSSLDVIRVAKATPAKRLGGLIGDRWIRFEKGLHPPVVIQAMGSQCIHNLVKILSSVWQKTARGGDVDEEVGFSCLLTQLSAGDNLYSGVQCELIAPARAQTSDE